MSNTEIQYGAFTKADCCEQCDYAHNTIINRSLAYNICPKCGNALTEVIGRWMFTEEYKWHRYFSNYGYPETTYHGFRRGTDISDEMYGTRYTEINDSGVVDNETAYTHHPDAVCDCPACRVSNSRTGVYQPCHNGKELNSPPKES